MFGVGSLSSRWNYSLNILTKKGETDMGSLRMELTQGKPFTTETQLKFLGFRLSKTLSNNEYSKVYKCKNKEGKTVAVKMVDLAKADRRKMKVVRRQTEREVELMERLKTHPSFVQLLFALPRIGQTVIVMEYLRGGTLLDLVLRHPLHRLADTHPMDYVRVIARQIVEGLEYMQERGMVHRDLKSENIMLDKYRNAKIGDLGFSRAIHPDQLSLTFSGTACYTAPELLLRKPYKCAAADMWSFGVVLYICFTGKFPIAESKLAHYIRHKKPVVRFQSLEECPSLAAIHLMESLLSYDPTTRSLPTAVKSSAWLKPTPWIHLDKFITPCCI